MIAGCRWGCLFRTEGAMLVSAQGNALGTRFSDRLHAESVRQTGGKTLWSDPLSACSSLFCPPRLFRPYPRLRPLCAWNWRAAPRREISGRPRPFAALLQGALPTMIRIPRALPWADLPRHLRCEKGWSPTSAGWFIDAIATAGTAERGHLHGQLLAYQRIPRALPLGGWISQLRRVGFSIYIAR
jgi:hypothetical protein